MGVFDDGRFCLSAKKIELVGYIDSEWVGDNEERKSTPY